MRKTLTFFRKPLKPILYSAIFAVLMLVASVFSLQYELDRIAIEETVNNYSYVGTIYDNGFDAPVLKALPSELVNRISKSKYTCDVENRVVLSGRTEDANAILDYFITQDTIDLYGMLEGHIWYCSYDKASGIETALLVVQQNWAGVLYGQSRVTVTAWRDKENDTNPDEPMFHEGDRVLVTGRFEFDTVNNGMKFTSLQICNPAINSPKNILDKNPVIYIPEEYERAQADAYIKEELSKRGMLEYVDKILACKNTFTIRPVSDMSMLMSFSGNSTYICGGRGITKADKGKKVCIINQFVASKNGLYVGDTIKLALSDTKYVCGSSTHDAEWETGIPKVGDEFPEYGEYEEYEIIGFYNFYTRRNCSEDFFKFSRNDIFIPVDESTQGSLDSVKPVNFSFKIKGPDYEDFMDEFEMELYEKGYVLQTVDTGWEDFEANYESMMSRKMVSAISAVLSFMAAVILFVVLILKHFKYEFGLRRLLGASTFEALRIYLAGYLALGIPALVIVLSSICFIYDKWLAVRMAEVMETGLPDTLGSLLLIRNWTACSFAAGLLLVLIIGIVNGKKNLLGLIK